MDDTAIIGYYNRRRVTRNEFEEFMVSQNKKELLEHAEGNSEDSKPFCCLLQTIPEDRREALFKIGNSVCRIDVNGVPQGTGFHLGGGWIMTNQHVICCHDEDNSDVSQASFIFPHKTFKAEPRNVIFSYFQNPVGTIDVDDSRKDLAIVHVDEIQSESIPALINIFQRPAENGERVYLVHYGDGVEDKSNPPQQFSVDDNAICFSVENMHGNQFFVHTAHSRPGSSGAPLLVFNEKLPQKFFVAAVHYAGPVSAKTIDSPGFALWYHNGAWLQDTVSVAAMINTVCQQAESSWWSMDNMELKTTLCENFLDDCRELEQYLIEHSLRVAMRVELPAVITFDSDTVIFRK